MLRARPKDGDPLLLNPCLRNEDICSHQLIKVTRVHSTSMIGRLGRVKENPDSGLSQNHLWINVAHAPDRKWIHCCQGMPAHQPQPAGEHEGQVVRPPPQNPAFLLLPLCCPAPVPKSRICPSRSCLQVLSYSYPSPSPHPTWFPHNPEPLLCYPSPSTQPPNF